ncbi:MAG: hypothetical protein KQH83_12235 [Actinobacteria bacterium]|nr:hypothetical protein [Actinomycetota bacterium]
MRKMAVMALAMALLVAACGDDDGLGDDEQGLADALATVMAADSDPTSPFTDREAAQCFAEGIVSEVGVDRMIEVGMTADASSTAAAFSGLSEGEIDVLADLALECVDVESMLVEQFALGGISTGSAECLADRMGETGLMKQAMIVGMTGDTDYDPMEDPAVLEDLFTAVTDCLTFEELQQISGG